MNSRQEHFGRQRKKKREKKLFKADLKLRTWNASIRKIPIPWPPAPHVQFVLNSSAAMQYIEPVSHTFLTASVALY